MPARILIVDDDDLREEVLDALRMSGLDADAVSDGRAALQRIERDVRFTVVLTDMVMPGLNGVELAAALRRVCPPEAAVETVVMTGFRLQDIDPGGLFAVLHKPMNFPELLGILQGAHDAAEKRRAAAVSG